MKVKKMTEEIELPEGVTAQVAEGIVTIKGEKGEVKKDLLNRKVNIEIKDKRIILSAIDGTKREKTMMGTFKSHMKNMIKGATQGHEYVLKICSGHFPMNVSVEGKNFLVKNFLGEKIPRKIVVKEGAQVKVDGTEVKVTGIDKNIVSQTSADIEQLTRIRNKDKRIFQDGIWIISKDGKEIK